MPQIIVIQSEDDFKTLSESIAEKVLVIIREELPQKKAVGTMLTSKELAKKLNISRDMVYKLSREGKIPHERIGTNLRFNEAEVQAALRPERRDKK